MEVLQSKNNRTKAEDGKEECKFDAILSPTDSHFSISLTPLLLAGYSFGSCKGELSCSLSGCVVSYDSNIPDGVHSKDIVQELISKVQTVANKPARLGLARAVTRLLVYQTDNAVEIMSAVKLASKTSTANQIAGYDEMEWFVTAKSQMIRSYAFLRRLAMPMHLHLLEDGMKLRDTLDMSFIDLLLTLEGLKVTVQKALHIRINGLRKDATAPGKRPIEVKLCKELENLLIKSLAKASMSSPPPATSSSSLSTETKEEESFGDSCTLPDHLQKEVVQIRGERRRLLRELEDRKKNGLNNISHYGVGGKIKLKNRMHNGCLLVTETEMTHEEFCRQVKIMVKVNKTLPRPYNPGMSRPRLHKVDLPQEALAKLRSIFFDKDGSLNRAIFEDVDLTTRHGYINFSNASCRIQRNDYRWQVPIKRHAMSFVSTRAAVESLFSEQKLLHPHHEKIHDLGILIGGTEDQSLHHDIPRQTTCWLPEDPDVAEVPGVVPVNGWEFDRAAYNEAMAGPYAPSSILLGMGPLGDLQVGVQKNQVERYGCAEGWCRILDGRPKDEFQIMRENDFLVVLKANPGALFTGDFPHAGVRNFSVGSAEDKLMMKFYGKIERILEEGQYNGEDHAEITKDMINMMCNFPNLNKLCRFHCSTEPTRGPLRIPRNTVGFVDCKPNPPDVGFEGRADEERLRAGLWSAI